MRPWLLSLTWLVLAAGGGPAQAQSKPAPDPAPQATPVGAAPVRTEPFPDVPKDHWAYDAVEQLRQRGILRGYPPDPAPKAAPRKRTPGKAAPRKPRTA